MGYDNLMSLLCIFLYTNSVIIYVKNKSVKNFAPTGALIDASWFMSIIHNLNYSLYVIRFFIFY